MISCGFGMVSVALGGGFRIDSIRFRVWGFWDGFFLGLGITVRVSIVLRV